MVAPVRERGLKFYLQPAYIFQSVGRSREGAWIEMPMSVLKLVPLMGRSREGAWIEIAKMNPAIMAIGGRSREGAWIEMSNAAHSSNVCGWGRSREGAWIEMCYCKARYEDE